jgi:hypothetical protein
VWDAEDAELIRLGKPNMFDKFTDPQVQNFVRASYFLCPKTKEFKTIDKDVQVTRVNSTNVLDEGLRIGEIGRRMNSKVKSVKQGVSQK